MVLLLCPLKSLTPPVKNPHEMAHFMIHEYSMLIHGHSLLTKLIGFVHFTL